MKISNKVREEAAIIASIGACDGHETGALDCALSNASEEARRLYWAAWKDLNAGPYRSASPASREHDAEAEALLRTGWSP